MSAMTKDESSATYKFVSKSQSAISKGVYFDIYQYINDMQISFDNEFVTDAPLNFRIIVTADQTNSFDSGGRSQFQINGILGIRFYNSPILTLDSNVQSLTATYNATGFSTSYVYDNATISKTSATASYSGPSSYVKIKFDLNYAIANESINANLNGYNYKLTISGTTTNVEITSQNAISSTIDFVPIMQNMVNIFGMTSSSGSTNASVKLLYSYDNVNFGNIGLSTAINLNWTIATTLTTIDAPSIEFKTPSTATNIILRSTKTSFHDGIAVHNSSEYIIIGGAFKWQLTFTLNTEYIESTYIKTYNITNSGWHILAVPDASTNTMSVTLTSQSELSGEILFADSWSMDGILGLFATNVPLYANISTSKQVGDLNISFAYFFNNQYNHYQTYEFYGQFVNTTWMHSGGSV